MSFVFRAPLLFSFVNFDPDVFVQVNERSEQKKRCSKSRCDPNDYFFHVRVFYSFDASSEIHQTRIHLTPLVLYMIYRQHKKLELDDILNLLAKNI